MEVIKGLNLKKGETDKEVLFPSGFKSNVLKMKGKTLNKLVNKKLIKEGTVFDEAIKECIPYSQKEDINNWLIGDKYFALIAMRIVTHGEKYQFKCQCPVCEEIGHYFVNLNELDVRYLDGRETENISFTLPNINKKVIYRLLRGKDEPLMKKIFKEKEDTLVTSLLALRTTSIEGEQMVTEEFFEELDADDIDAFRQAIEEQDCGVDTTLILTCKCGAEFEQELPLDADFFSPKRPKSR